MKLLFTALIVGSLVGCSTSPTKTVDAPQITAVQSQKLLSNFKRQGIKIEFDCGTISSWTSGCNKAEPTAIEVTGYAPAFGNSEALEEEAYRAAELDARRKFIEFVKSDISSSTNSNIISKNFEKANDQIKQRINSGEVITMDEDEAKEFNKNSNIATRENANQITRIMTTNIRQNSTGIMKGFREVDGSARPVSNQRVAITFRWDRDSERTATFFGKMTNSKSR
jgi:hypothetical protein